MAARIQCTELWRNTTDELDKSRPTATSTRYVAHLSKILTSRVRQYCTVYNRHSSSLAGQIQARQKLRATDLHRTEQRQLGYTSQAYQGAIVCEWSACGVGWNVSLV